MKRKPKTGAIKATSTEASNKKVKKQKAGVNPTGCLNEQFTGGFVNESICVDWYDPRDRGRRRPKVDRKTWMENSISEEKTERTMSKKPKSKAVKVATHKKTKASKSIAETSTPESLEAAERKKLMANMTDTTSDGSVFVLGTDRPLSQTSTQTTTKKGNSPALTEAEQAAEERHFHNQQGKGRPKR